MRAIAVLKLAAPDITQLLLLSSSSIVKVFAAEMFENKALGIFVFTLKNYTVVWETNNFAVEAL